MAQQPLKWAVEPVAVIFAGGEGKRLWPISTQDQPKQINPFFSKDTLVLEAYRRARRIFRRDRIVIVTTRRLVKQLRRLVPLPEHQYIVQPENVDTSAAIAITALVLSVAYPNSLAVVLYSDHLIEDLGAFCQDLHLAVHLATDQEEIMTVGTRPTSPVVDFGYIKLGAASRHKRVFTIDSFHEKPTLKEAEKYVSSGEYLWNTGVYLWKPNVLLAKIKELQPDLYEQLLQLRIAVNTTQFEKTVLEWYKQAPHISFEKSISEKLHRMLVFVAEYTWYDVGNWRSVYQLHHKDPHDNVVLNGLPNQVKFVDSQDCLVFAQARRVGVVGMKRAIIIQTKNELLVCDQDAAIKVKEVVNSG